MNKKWYIFAFVVLAIMSLGMIGFSVWCIYIKNIPWLIWCIAFFIYDTLYCYKYYLLAFRKEIP